MGHIFKISYDLMYCSLQMINNFFWKKNVVEAGAKQSRTVSWYPISAYQENECYCDSSSGWYYHNISAFRQIYSTKTSYVRQNVNKASISMNGTNLRLFLDLLLSRGPQYLIALHTHEINLPHPHLWEIFCSPLQLELFPFQKQNA